MQFIQTYYLKIIFYSLSEIFVFPETRPMNSHWRQGLKLNCFKNTTPRKIVDRLPRFSDGAAAQIIPPRQNWHRTIRNIERNNWILNSSRSAHFYEFTAVFRPTTWEPPRRRRRPAGRNRPSEDKMATSALQSRGYDPEAMAWTSVPTTGDQNSTVFPKIRSQALLQAAERRSQDKAKMTASDVAPAIGSSVGNVNAPATRATGSCPRSGSRAQCPNPLPKTTL